MRLTAVNVHPLKSAASRPVTSAEVLRRGLADDRSWMVVDARGVLVSAREEPRLLSLVADTPRTAPEVSCALRLRAAGRPDLEEALPSGREVAVRLHRNDLRAVEASERAHAWLRSAVGREDLRLVWCHDPARRSLNPLFSEPGDHTAFADGYPVTVASEASLEQLNGWIAETAAAHGEGGAAPIAMQRFRASLVVDGLDAFAEDGWRRVRVGEVSFRVAKPVDRCSMTRIDPQTLVYGKEPIRTLARHRLSVDRKTLFAVHLVPVTTGTVRVGDSVSVD